jgi:hypothetical protein
MDDPSKSNPKTGRTRVAIRLGLVAGLLLVALLALVFLSRPDPDFTGGEPPPAIATTGLPQPGLDRLLSQVLNALPQGRMVFNPPQEMGHGEKERVELRVLPLSDSIDETQAQATLVAGLQGAGTPQVQALRVGTVMKARLSGDGFEITPLNDEEQVVSSDTFTQWAWDATALRAGEQELNLLVSVRVFAGELGERGRDLPVITKGVQVRVDPVYSIQAFLSRNWQWLATTLVLPLGGWLYKRYSGRRAGVIKEKD